MGGYTKLNLTEDVEDFAPKFGLGEVLNAHFAREAIEAQKFGLSLQRLKPNQRMPFGHRHEQQEEVYVVVGGSGRLKVEDEVLDLAGARDEPGVLQDFQVLRYVRQRHVERLGQFVDRQFTADECPQDLNARGVREHPEDLDDQRRLILPQPRRARILICIHT